MNVVSLADVKSMILFYLFLDFYDWFFSLYLFSVILVSFILLANCLLFALNLTELYHGLWEKRPKLLGLIHYTLGWSSVMVKVK